MQIENSKSQFGYTQIELQKTKTKDKLTNEEVSELRIEIKSFQITVAQNALDNFKVQQPKGFEEIYKDFQKTLEEIGYKGKPIAELSQEEANELILEDGFFGINKTSERLSGFVINGAGDDIDMLRAGREGIVKGYEEAEAFWGGELPEISQKTLQKALEEIDAKITSLGFSVVDIQA